MHFTFNITAATASRGFVATAITVTISPTSMYNRGYLVHILFLFRFMIKERKIRERKEEVKYN